MKTTHVLVVDNEPLKAKLIAERLNRLANFKAIRGHDGEEALELLGKSNIDCVLIDLDLREGKKRGERVLEGIPLGEKIRAAWPHVGILMYSMIIDPRRADTPAITAAGKAAGAYAVLPREHFTSAPINDIAAEIAAAIAAVRPEDFTVAFSPSFRMNAVLETYDPESLKGLLRKHTPVYKFYWVKALQAGFSGAAVLHVNASNREDGNDAAEWVLKIAGSRQPLEHEIARKPEFGTTADRTGVAAHDSEVVNFGEKLFGFRTRFVTGMQLLRDFLQEPSVDTAAEAVLHGVVDQLLKPPVNAASGAVPGFVLKATAGVELVDFLEEAAGWTAVLTATDLAAVASTRRLIERILKDGGRLPWASGSAAVLHGDFHGRNVFVKSGADPRCIDFARRETFPRLFDFAALDADLTLGAPCAGRGAEFVWADIARWKQERTALFPFVQIYRLNGGSRSDRLRYFMLEEIRAFGGTAAEYAQVLAFQYWRYLRFPVVAPAKKILACHLVEELSRVTGTAVE